MRRAGILRFIDQHMPDGTVQLPGHPFCRITLLQHGVGQRDQIIIVKKAKPPFQGCIANMKGPAINIKGACQFAATTLHAGGNKSGKGRLYGLQNVHKIRKCLAQTGIRQAAFG